MITIARDPAEIIISKLAMSVFYDKDNKTINTIRKNELTEDVEYYFNNIEKLDVTKDFFAVVNYKDLIEHPLGITMTLADMINLPIITKEYVEGSIKDNPKNGHIVSSKNVPEYQEITEYVETLDLSFLYKFYNEALNMCIKPIL